MCYTKQPFTFGDEELLFFAHCVTPYFICLLIALSIMCQSHSGEFSHAKYCGELAQKDGSGLKGLRFKGKSRAPYTARPQEMALY